METIASLGLNLNVDQWLAASRQADTGLAQVERRAGAMTGVVQRLEGGFQRAAAQLRTMVAIAGIGFGTSQLIRYADTWTNIGSKLALVTKNTAQLRDVQEKLFDVAQNTRTSFESTVDLYSRVARNAKNLGLAQSDLIRLTQSVNQAMVISGSSAGSAQAALVQLGQAFASGTLRGEELNSVMEQAPRLAEAIATGMGKSVGELRRLGAQGKLTSEEVVKALLSQSDTIAKEYGKMKLTISQAFTQLSNSFGKFIGESSSASGAASLIADAISKLAKNLNDLTAVLITLAGIKIATTIGGWSQSFLLLGGSLTRTFAVLSRAVSMLGGMGTATVLASRGLQALASFLGGPVGIALTAVSIGIGVYLKRANDAAKETEAFRSSLEKLTEQQLLSQMATLTQRLEEIYVITSQMGRRSSNLTDEANQIRERIKAITDAIQTLRSAGGGTATTPKIVDDKELKKALETIKSLRERVADLRFSMSDPTEFQTFSREMAELGKQFAEVAKKGKVGQEGVKFFRGELEELKKLKAAQLAKELRKEFEDLSNSLTPSGRDDALTQLRRELEEMQKKNMPEFIRSLYQKAREGAIAASEANERFVATMDRISRLKPLPKLTALDVERRNLETAIFFEKNLERRQQLQQQLNAVTEEYNQTLQQSQVTVQTTAELTRASVQEMENLMRGIQSAFSSFFENIFEEGVQSFSRLMASLRQLFTRTLGEMLAQKMAAKLFDIDRDAQGNITNIGIRGGRAGQTGVAGIAGGLAGWQVGTSFGQGTRSPSRAALGGALGGAAAGALAGTAIAPGIGTAIGAVVGAVSGMISGFVTSSKKAEEAAKAMRKAREEFDRNMKLFTDAAAGTLTDLSRQLQGIEDNRKKLLDEAKAYIPKGRQEGLNISLGNRNPEEALKFLTEMKSALGFLPAAWDKYLKKLEEVNAAAAKLAEQLKKEFIDNIEAQIRELDGRGYVNTALGFIKQLEENRKQLEQAGGDAGRATLLFELQLKKLVETLSDAEFKTLLDSLPDAFKELAERLRKEFKDQPPPPRQIDTEADAAAKKDIEVRRLVLQGKEDEAALLTLIIQQEQELAAARKNGLSDATIAALAQLQAEEKLAFIRKQEAEKAEKARRFAEDIELRMLAVMEQMLGKDLSSDRRREIANRRELFDAEQQGLKPSQIRQIKYAQELEKLAADFAKATQEMIDAINEATIKVLKEIDAKIRASQSNIETYRARISAIQERTQAEVSKIDEQIAVHRELIDATKSQIDAIRDQASTARSLATRLGDFVRSLTEQDESLSPEERLRLAKEAYLNATPDQFADAAKAYLDAAKQYFGSGTSYQDILSEVKNRGTGLATSAFNAAAAAEAQLGALNQIIAREETSIKALEDQKAKLIDRANKQIEALERQIKSEEQTIQALEKQRQTIIEAAQKQIEELIKTRQQEFEAAAKALAEQQRLREEVAKLTDPDATPLKDLKISAENFPDMKKEVTDPLDSRLEEVKAALDVEIAEVKAVASATTSGAGVVANRIDGLRVAFDALAAQLRLQSSRPGR